MTEKVDGTMKQEFEAKSSDYEYNTLMRLLGVSVSKHLLDEHFTLIWANDFYYDLIGWDKDEYVTVYHNRPDLYYKDYPKEWKELGDAVIKALADHDNGYTLVSRMPKKNGEFVWVKFSTSFSEEYVNGYQVAYTTMTNIDDLMQMEREQSITYNNLPGFVARFRVEEDGFHFLNANDRFAEFFGDCSERELTYGLSNFSSEQNHATLTLQFPKMRKGEQVHFTLQAKDKYGNDIWLQVNGDCIFWQNGAPVYLVIYIDITDITEQRELQRQLEERSKMLSSALQSAEQANKAKSEFLSRMSHDIRTPMNAVMGMTSIAQSHIDDKDRVLNCLEKITLSSKLLLGLINEVLDMSRIESGRIALTKEEFSLNDLLKNIISVIQPLIDEKHHSFDIYAYELKHENVIGDPQRIQQVFLNLLSNAVKYTPDSGRITFEIREKLSDIPEYCCYEFSVSDNGYGMKPEFLKKLFVPFERADDPEVSSIQGTGLGMAISQNIVHMMKGSIQVQSDYGKGSKFTVSLYLQVQQTEDMAAPLCVDFPVLVVDDDIIACETVCERLNEIGLKSRWVLSGEEAIQRAREAHQKNEDFFAAIVDLKMPGMDGIETIRQIRREVGPKLPILLISAYDWMEFEEDAVNAGADGFVVKPMLKSSLVYAIKRYVLKENVISAASGPKPPKQTYEGKHLLLVEDNALNREIAVETISQTGIKIECAVNGLEAVEKFELSEEGYYDFIFMDLQMPVMDGLEASRRIRRLERRDAKAVPIVAMTANTFAEDIASTKDAGMNGHLAKPFDIELLYQVMEKYLL